MIEEEKAVATVEKYIRDINVFADWLGNKEFDNDGTLNCVLGAEGHIAFLDAVHSNGIGGHCAVIAAGVCTLCVNANIESTG